VVVAAPATTGESWLTVRAVLADDAPWAPAGHEIAWGQGPANPRWSADDARAGQAVTASPDPDGVGGMRDAVDPGASVPIGGRVDDSVVRVGAGEFDPHTGRLVRLGGIDVDGPLLDVWRAPTDNDDGQPHTPAKEWRRYGLDRMRHRTDAVVVGNNTVGNSVGENSVVGNSVVGNSQVPGEDDTTLTTLTALTALTVRTRVAPAAVPFGLLTTYRWTAVDDGALRLDVDVEPDGTWPDIPLPRLGVRLALPSQFGQATWFGGGPGEAYPDTRQAVRVGRYTSTVDEMQTPYVYPQENGHRIDVRWAELTAQDLPSAPAALRIEGSPMFGLTVRRWTSHDLDAAKHPHELAARDRVYVNLDLVQHGIGSGSCGPGVLPQHVLRPESAHFAVTFRQVAGLS
ncbi:beta-galactosidase small subunit family protein, partial [Phytoactinopolyspora endophytica]|uniref:beta-galactosidase small subunit family protein n=1 Tax=Phytoactinopolyspora endophytica TaxID=1642495 RepID=UPI001F0D1D21